MKRASCSSSLRALAERAAAGERRFLFEGAADKTKYGLFEGVAADASVAAGAGVSILLTGIAGVPPNSRSVVSRTRSVKSSVGALDVVFSTGGILRSRHEE